jgi:hypothetical protein
VSRPQITLPHWSRWETLPRDEGQIVAVAYATDGDTLYRRCYDRSDQSTTYYCAEIVSDDLERDYDPANGSLPKAGPWERCEIADES